MRFNLSENFTFPKMATIRQSFYAAPLDNSQIGLAVATEFEKVGWKQKIQPGQQIAIGAGSRGISNIALIIKLVVEQVKAVGAQPFVFPAMGSHGGATAQGQVEMLASLGITAEYLGCPIKSNMEPVQLGSSTTGLPVWLDRNAAAADGIIVVNRVKPHTNFRGEIESGLMKMLSIGAGKQKQAHQIHSFGVSGLHDYIPEVARAVLKLAPVLGGFAIVEDGYHQTSKIVGLPAESLERQEIELLHEAKHNMPALPLKALDLVIIDRMGKNISGAGMDTNILGRTRLPGLPAFPEPNIQVVATLDLTEESHGNAVGLGLADLITRRLADKIDFYATYMNALTGNGPQQGATPIMLDTDHEAVQIALEYLVGPIGASQVKVCHIKDTLALDQIQVSEAVLNEIRGRDGIEVVTEPEPMTFDGAGNLAAIVDH